MLYQYDWGSKLWIDVINEVSALQALVNEYLSPMVDSELFLLKKFVLIPVSPFVIVISLDENELLMTKSLAVTDTIVFKVDMKLITTTVWRWNYCVKKIETKNIRKIIAIEMEWKLNN